MPARWDDTQKLYNGRIEWPTGDMTVPSGFTARWVEAWAVQGGGMGAGLDLLGPSQSTSHSASWSAFTGNRWTADSPGWVAGSFEAGPALGIALLASRNSAGATHYNWWFGVVTLDEMTVDRDFIDRFNVQISILENIKESVEGAITAAREQLNRIVPEELRDDVFANK